MQDANEMCRLFPWMTPRFFFNENTARAFQQAQADVNFTTLAPDGGDIRRGINLS